MEVGSWKIFPGEFGLWLPNHQSPAIHQAAPIKHLFSRFEHFHAPACYSNVKPFSGVIPEGRGVHTHDLQNYKWKSLWLCMRLWDWDYEFWYLQLDLSHRQLYCSTLILNKSPFLGYPTCRLFAHAVWWSTALWTTWTTGRRRPGQSLTLESITSVWSVFNQDVICCGDGGGHESVWAFNMSDSIMYM